MRLLYLVSGDRWENHLRFRDRVLDLATNRLAPLAEDAVISLTEEKPPLVSVIPFRKDRMALISLDGVDPALDSASLPMPRQGFAGAYLADVAFPVVHQRSWSVGRRSPGAGLLTLFRRLKGLEEEEFLRRWFEGHTPLTLELHPNVGYVRNRLIGTFGGHPGEQRAWDGIVEEQYDPDADLLNPARFFGGSLAKMPGAMARVYKDIKGFIDYRSIRTWLTREYRVKESFERKNQATRDRVVAGPR